jgi:hypothetical protein
VSLLTCDKHRYLEEHRLLEGERLGVLWDEVYRRHDARG